MSKGLARLLDAPDSDMIDAAPMQTLYGPGISTGRVVQEISPIEQPGGDVSFVGTRPNKHPDRIEGRPAMINESHPHGI